MPAAAGIERVDCSVAVMAGNAHIFFSVPPSILVQSPAGMATKAFGSRAMLSCPAHEWPGDLQSFL
jgi:hypothetical protein